MDIWGGGGSLRNRTFFFFFLGGGGGRAFLNILGLFKVKMQNGIFFFGQQNFKYFWVCLIFLIFFYLGGGGGGGWGLNSRCWVQAYG